MANRAHINYLPGLLAGASLAAKQYHAVKMATTAGEVVAVSATTDVAIGLVQNDPADGEAASVAGPGSVAIGIAGTSTISQGNVLGFDSTGRLVNHTTDDRASIGLALESASAVSDEITVVVIGAVRY